MKLSTKTLTLLVLLGATIATSCKKDPIEEVDMSFLSVTNTSPTLGTYNFYLNQGKVNTGAMPFGGTINYFQVKSGEYAAKLTTESSTESLASENFTFEKDKIYSLFFIDKGANLDYLLVNDEVRSLSVEKAYIRFINLSPDAPALSLIAKDSAAVVSDKTYKSVSTFVEINPKLYTLQIKDKVTGATISKDLPNVDIKRGKFYTVISKGLLNPSDTEQPFGGLVISN